MRRLLVCGCMVVEGVGNLHFIKATMDQYSYINIINQNSENIALGRDYIFQQNNDPK